MTARAGWLRAMPVVAYLLIFFAIPLAWFIAQSFVGAHGGLSLEHYQSLFATPTYLRVLWITFKIAGITTLISLVAGYPLAYYIAQASKGRRNSLMIWVLLPFWTSFLVRTFVWLVILGSHGPVQDLLQRLA
ncbi:MAG: ABC transporter permease, partial [Vulcanimicrobiaceae bacterium]